LKDKRKTAGSRKDNRWKGEDKSKIRGRQQEEKG
jgi:hypothetical protein